MRFRSSFHEGSGLGLAGARVEPPATESIAENEAGTQDQRDDAAHVPSVDLRSRVRGRGSRPAMPVMRAVRPE